MARKWTTVEDWVKDCLLDDSRGAPCTAFVCLHMKAVGSDEVAHRSVTATTADSAEIARHIVSKAEGYSQAFPGHQTFRIEAFYSSNEPKASFHFNCCEGNLISGTQDTPFSKHETSEKGLLGQLMSHNEKIMQMCMSITQTFAVGALPREEGHRREQAEMTVIMRDMLLAQRKEMLEAELQKLQFQRQSDERLLIGKLVPSLANYLTGREVIPQSHADSEILDAIAMKIKPEHIALLTQVGILDEQQAAVLAARFTKTRVEAEKRQALLKTMPPELNGVPKNNEGES